MKKYLIFITIFIFFGCAKKSMSNQQTLVTSDCGKTWSVIEAGQSIPMCRINCQCSYDVSLPNYPMQGDANFKFAFKENVLASVEIAYDYEIDNPLLFIREAKYLGKPNVSETSTDTNLSQYESAENSVIDIRIRDVAREIFSAQDVVDFQPSEVEGVIYTKVNKLLSERGVILNSLSMVIKFDEQTKLAIDVATAYKVYTSKDLQTVGVEIMKAKASATTTINQK
jgi:hypothetical protein